MTTARDSIYAALRALRKTPSGEVPTASEADDALGVLNRMMHSWKAEGADIGHNDLALSDEHVLPPEFDEAVIYLLLVRLGHEYGEPLTTADSILANKGWQAIVAEFGKPGDLSIEPGLMSDLSRFGRYNINNG